MRMTFSTIVFGGLAVFFAVVAVVVFIPTQVLKPEPTLVAHPYTPEQERGRKLFYSNGCNYCHTQYVRASDTAMGDVSLAGDYAYDNPLILGSERTGPDLTYIGRKRSEAWEIDHLKNPRKYSPMSIMPSYDFLPDDDLKAIAAYLFALGNRVAEENMITPPPEYAGLTTPLPNPEMQPATGANPAPQGWDAWYAAGLQEGKEIYVKKCLTCHGAAGNGLGSYAGTLVVTPADFKQEPFRSMPDDQWFWHVSEGIPGTVMPPWKESLTEDERWKVIRYIQETFAQPIMRDPDEGDPPDGYAGLTNPVPLTTEALEVGKQIFTRECSVCHGYAGTGDGIYAAGLQPSPPDFSDGRYGTIDKPSFSDADYFWRISEGLPWSAMPAWKSQYSEEDRWKLVHYLRTLFTQTEEPLGKPTDGPQFDFPDAYKSLEMPESASFERGKQIFLERCSACHGLAGDGNGPDGRYLAIKPADYRQMSGMALDQKLDAMMFAKVTFGIKGTAMPSWGEILSVQDRWDVIRYVQDAFVAGVPAGQEAVGATALPADVLTLSQSNWTDEGHTISADAGKQVYEARCAACHGIAGNGQAPGLVNGPSGAPPAFSPDLGFGRIFATVRAGVRNGIMPAFKQDLSDEDLWNVTSYVAALSNGTTGGASQ
jgi:mono/diheme cytochrome c family protein